MNIVALIRKDPIMVMIAAIPLAILAEAAGWDPLWVFSLTALGIIPLAHLIGESTEALAHYTGPRLGGLLNATLGNAAELIITIIAIRQGLLFGYRTAHEPAAQPAGAADHAAIRPHWSLRTALILLAIATVGVAYLSELLVGAVEPIVVSYGISEFFLGIILIPLIGNVAEHLVAVQVAVQNKMDLSVEISLASSLQIALFVAPVLVFISLLMNNPLTLIFNQFELLALIAGVLIAGLVSIDGESNWLEGAALLAVYLILGLAFFFMPL